MSKKNIRAAVALLAVWSLAPAVFASVESECREEVDLYGIPAELADQYLADCIATRGGGSADSDPVYTGVSPDMPEDEPSGAQEPAQ